MNCLVIVPHNGCFHWVMLKSRIARSLDLYGRLFPSQQEPSFTLQYFWNTCIPFYHFFFFFFRILHLKRSLLGSHLENHHCSQKNTGHVPVQPCANQMTLFDIIFSSCGCEISGVWQKECQAFFLWGPWLDWVKVSWPVFWTDAQKVSWSNGQLCQQCLSNCDFTRTVCIYFSIFLLIQDPRRFG